MSKSEKQLFLAVIDGDLNTVTSLISQGVSPNIRTDTQMTPLMAAVRANNAVMVRCLLNLGCDDELTDYLGRDAYDYAEKYNSRAALITMITFEEDTYHAE